MVTLSDMHNRGRKPIMISVRAMERILIVFESTFGDNLLLFSHQVIRDRLKSRDFFVDYNASYSSVALSQRPPTDGPRENVGSPYGKNWTLLSILFHEPSSRRAFCITICIALLSIGSVRKIRVNVFFFLWKEHTRLIGEMVFKNIKNN